MPVKITTDQFVTKANLKHNNKYTYELVNYVNAYTKVEICCPIHGPFEQTPGHHLKGQGCRKCANESTAKVLAAKAKSEFVSKARSIHGDKYTYELVDYVNSQNKVKINCPTHGVFEQSPASHVNGESGCPLCTGSKAAQAKASSEFIDKAREIHGDKYDYSETVYVSSHTKVKITCGSHGSWEQTPNSHLSGQGCPICALSEKGWTRTHFKDRCTKNNNGLGILYVLECFNDTESFIKIGITSRSIKERYKDKGAMPYAYRVIDEIIGDSEYIFDLEKELHKQHKEHRYEPNIPFGGSSTECFKTYITNK